MDHRWVFFPCIVQLTSLSCSHRYVHIYFLDVRHITLTDRLIITINIENLLNVSKYSPEFTKEKQQSKTWEKVGSNSSRIIIQMFEGSWTLGVMQALTPSFLNSSQLPTPEHLVLSSTLTQYWLRYAKGGASDKSIFRITGLLNFSEKSLFQVTWNANYSKPDSRIPIESNVWLIGHTL